jgi:hypothetical protein
MYETRKLMLCFEVWRNDQKLVTAGLSKTGVLSFMLTWVGKEPDASSVAAASAEIIPGLRCDVGGIDSAPDPLGDKYVDWYEMEGLKIGDELRVRIISSDTPDPPLRSLTSPRGKPDWLKKNQE